MAYTVYNFPQQCGARVLWLQEGGPTDQTLKQFKQDVKTWKSKRRVELGDLGEFLLVVTLGPAQKEWEPILEEHGFRCVQRWYNYNYEERLGTGETNSMWICAEGPKEKTND